MTGAGYLFMGLAWTLITGLTVFCYMRIFRD